METFGIAWQCLEIFGIVWQCSAMLGNAQQCLKMLSNAWQCLVYSWPGITFSRSWNEFTFILVCFNILLQYATKLLILQSIYRDFFWEAMISSLFCYLFWLLLKGGWVKTLFFLWLLFLKCICFQKIFSNITKKVAKK